jgi:hypothetical protein
MVPNSRIDIRISNTEKDQWQQTADARGQTLTQLIKQAVRQSVQQATGTYTGTPIVPVQPWMTVSGTTSSSAQ